MGKRRVGSGRPLGQKKPPLTHFLCVPLVTPASRPQLEASLKTFKNHVSPSEQDASRLAEKVTNNNDEAVLPFVHPKSIRPVGTLHCTLGVMSLDKDKLSEAISLLEGTEIQDMTKDACTPSKVTYQTKPSADESVAASSTTLEKPITPPPLNVAGEPFKVDLIGLVSMHPPKNTSILYTAPSDDSGRLLPFCIALQKVFKDKGFITEDRPLKLHATIVNTIYAKGRKEPPRGNVNTSGIVGAQSQPGEANTSNHDAKSQGHGPKANAPLKIDVTAILEKYQDFVWAKDVALDRVAICEMGAKKIMDEDGNVKDEEYTEVASIALPQ